MSNSQAGCRVDERKPRALDVDFGMDDFGSVEDSDLETAALCGVGFFGGLWLTHRVADRLKWCVIRELRANHLDSGEVTKLFTLRLDPDAGGHGPTRGSNGVLAGAKERGLGRRFRDR